MTAAPRLFSVLFLSCLLAWPALGQEAPPPLRAGVAKADLSPPGEAPLSSPPRARVLALEDGHASALLIAMDVVAIGGIGQVGDDFLPALRERIQRELGLDPSSLIVNASHCHASLRPDFAESVFQAVKEARGNMVPVRAGAGSGREDRIMENRRLLLQDGRETDVRHAYALPPDAEVAAIGPVDPEIGLLRLDREEDGQTLALVYHFACHPIQGVPGGGNTADLTGFASAVIEENLGPGAVALFLQGCGGDINPVAYKAADLPRDAETLGNLLGLSALRAARAIETRPRPGLSRSSEILSLPRADHAARIEALEAEEIRLLRSLRGTSLNLKTFLPLYVKYHLSGEHPSAASHAYLLEELAGREGLAAHDEQNRRLLDAYLRNIHVMEEITRVQVNLALLERHQARNAAAGGEPVPAEIAGLRVGEFSLVTFPAEVTVEVGLNIKAQAGRPFSYVSGYTNGYLWYAPTAAQLANPGWAQEDCDSLLAPEWQALFEAKALEILSAR